MAFLGHHRAPRAEGRGPLPRRAGGERRNLVQGVQSFLICGLYLREIHIVDRVRATIKKTLDRLDQNNPAQPPAVKSGLFRPRFKVLIGTKLWTDPGLYRSPLGRRALQVLLGCKSDATSDAALSPIASRAWAQRTPKAVVDRPKKGCAQRCQDVRRAAMGTAALPYRLAYSSANSSAASVLPTYLLNTSLAFVRLGGVL